MGDNSAYLFIPVVLLLMAFRIWRKGGRTRRLRIETMWIMPLLFALLIGAGIAAAPPPMTPLLILALAAALIAGLAVGWLRGRTTSITVEPETHVLNSKLSPAGLVILAALFLTRYAARELLGAHAEEWHVPPTAVVDGFMLLAGGSIVGARIEILIRCLRLLREARAAKAAGQSVPAEVTEDHA
jgi:hypothetical protein